MAADWNIEKLCADLQKVIDAKQMEEVDVEHVAKLIAKIKAEPAAIDQTFVYNWLMENPHPSKKLTLPADCKNPLRRYQPVRDRSGQLLDLLFALRFSSHYN